MATPTYIPTTEEKLLATLLREVRNETGKSQEEFAKLLGVSNRSLSRYETLTGPIPGDVLLKLKDRFEKFRQVFAGTAPKFYANEIAMALVQNVKAAIEDGGRSLLPLSYHEQTLLAQMRSLEPAVRQRVLGMVSELVGSSKQAPASH
jgi:transcriptional regulator with XRE-family HTH domain